MMLILNKLLDIKMSITIIIVMLLILSIFLCIVSLLVIKSYKKITRFKKDIIYIIHNIGCIIVIIVGVSMIILIIMGMYKIIYGYITFTAKGTINYSPLLQVNVQRKYNSEGLTPLFKSFITNLYTTKEASVLFNIIHNYPSILHRYCSTEQILYVAEELYEEAIADVEQLSANYSVSPTRVKRNALIAGEKYLNYCTQLEDISKNRIAKGQLKLRENWY